MPCSGSLLVFGGAGSGMASAAWNRHSSRFIMKGKKTWEKADQQPQKRKYHKHKNMEEESKEGKGGGQSYER